MRAMDSPTVHRRLIDRLDRAESPEAQWRLLMAAHVAAQLVLRLHWDSHCRMLALAWRERDAAELAGQLLRLALVPLGHVLRRLPAGNTGRSTVNAFRPMQPPPEVAALLRWAQDGA